MNRRTASWTMLPLLAALAMPVFASDEGPVLGLIVKTKPAAGILEAPQAALNRVALIAQRRGVGYHQVRQTALGAHVLSAGRALSREEARAQAQRLLADPDVEYVAANTLERRQATPNDPAYEPLQWWLQGPNASAASPNFPAAWDIHTGNSSVVVAVLDSGIRRFHPEFTVGSSRLLNGYDFVSEVEYANDGDGLDSDATDPGDWVSQEDKALHPSIYGGCEVAESTWHGTVIAGQLVASTNDNHGIAGMTWSGRLLPVRVAGKCGAAVSDIVEGMLWAAGIPYTGSPAANPNPARIVNLSFGGSRPCDVNSGDELVAGTARLYTDAIEALRVKGAVLVAAAGNDGDAVVRPASCAGALAVTALDRDGAKADYANFGSEVDVATIGGATSPAGNGIYSTTNTGTRGPVDEGYGFYAGTSFATPIVSGTVALMLAVNPDLSVDQIISGIRATTRPHVQIGGLGSCSAIDSGYCSCTTGTCGAGVLDAPEAVAWALATEGTFIPPTSNPSLDFIPDRLQAGGSGSSGDGGGAAGPFWLLGLLAAAAALSVRRRR
jgi:serine protease